MLRFSLPIIVCLLAFLIADAQAAGSLPSFTLVKTGKPVATIVTAEKASPAALFAVRELQYHIRRITGTSLPVAKDSQNVTGPMVLVGRSKHTDKLGLTNQSLKSQEFVVKITPQTLVIMGKDDLSLPPDYLTRKPGKFGKAIEFDGENSFVSVSDSGFEDSEGTMEAWIKIPAQTQPNEGTIIRMDSANPWTYRILRRLADSNIVHYVAYDGSAGSGIHSKELDTGWHHIMVTHSDTSGLLEMFVDGVSQGTTTQRKTFCKDTTMYLGGMPKADGSGAGNAFTGLIDEVRVSNIVRKSTGSAPSAPFVADANTTVLMHFDESAGQPSNSATQGSLSGLAVPEAALAPEFFTEKGTMDAVYEFLEKYCGVDWFAPGEVNTLCPKSANLTVKGNGLRTTPSFEYRWMVPTPIYWPTRDQQVSANEVELWRYRMKMGGKPFSCNHSFYGFYERFLKSNPDWFAQGYDGEPPQMCYSNQGFIDQVVKDAKEYFNTGKYYTGAMVNGDFFGLCPMDNGNYCNCPDCKSKINEAELGNKQFSNGTMSNYWFDFVNRVAREVHKTHPNKWIGSLAYADYAYRPDKVQLESNIAVMMCLHTRNWWCPSMERNDRKILEGWVSESSGKRPLYVWLYYCFPALSAQSQDYAMFPGFFVHTMADQVRMYKKSGIAGMFLEHTCEFNQPFLGDQLEMYINWKMCTDVNVNVEKLIDKFFTGYYGDAAGPMKKLYLDIEETYSNPKSYPDYIQNTDQHYHHTRELTYEYLATPQRMEKYTKLISEAKAAASTDLELQRIKNFDAALIRPLVSGSEKYKVFKSTHSTIMPEPVVPKVASVDPGNPESIDWTKALNMGAWVKNNGDRPDRTVSSKIAHDGAFIYMELEDNVDTSKLVIGPQVWNGDDYEFFFADNREKPYRQIAISPSGGVFATGYGDSATGWTKPIVATSNVEENKWTVRLAMPLDSVSIGAASSRKFYANFFRNSVGSPGQFAWNPAYEGGFHNLSRMCLFALE